MRRLTILCLFIVINLVLNAKNKGAIIEFKKTVHNFGNIKEEDGIVSYSFEFINKGSAPLVINDAIASCGCTTPEWTKAPIAPGKSGKIKIAYNPVNRPGPFDKPITIYSNTKNSTTMLYVKGNVIEKKLGIEEKYPIRIGSLRLKNNIIAFARMANNAKRTENLEVYNDSSSPLIISFENVPVFIKIEADPISIPAKQIGTIKCTYFASKKNDIGPVTDKITVKTNNSIGIIEVQAMLDEDISKLTQADFEKAPVAIMKSSTSDFGTIQQGEKITAKYEIKNSGKSDLLIRKLTPDCTCLKISVSPQTIKPGQVANIIVELNSKNEIGQKFYNITLTTNAPRQQLINLFLMGNIK